MEGTVIDMRSETMKLQQKMKEQDDYLARHFAEATSPEKKMRHLQEQMQDRASEPREKKSISVFSPAQRAAFSDTVTSGTSGVLMDVGRTLTSNQFNMTR